MSGIANPVMCTDDSACTAYNANGNTYFCSMFQGSPPPTTGYCLMTFPEFTCSDEADGIRTSAGGPCVCPPDMLFDITAGKCLPAPCQTSPAGYYFTACPGEGACVNELCIDPQTPTSLTPTCNQPTDGSTCMSYFASPPVPGTTVNWTDPGFNGTIDYTTITVNGNTSTITPSTLLDAMLFVHETDGTNDTCAQDPTLNVGKNTYGECYYNSFANGNTSTSITPASTFLSGVATGSATDVLQFDLQSYGYVGANFGNYPRQTNLFLMFANENNVSWLTPNQCQFNVGDAAGPCTDMGAGMRCVPGTTPVMVSECLGNGTDSGCDANGSGWHTFAGLDLPSGVNIQTHGNGPTMFSVWSCSADAAHTANDSGGSSCPTGFEPNIVYAYDDGVTTAMPVPDRTGRYIGTCVRVPNFQSPGGDDPGLAWSYCNYDAGKAEYVRNSSCADESAMCWSSSCTIDSVRSTDTIPYIPIGYAYPSTDTDISPDGVKMDLGYKLCTVENADVPGHVGCSSDLHRLWIAECESGGLRADCSGSGNQTTWHPVGNF